VCQSAGVLAQSKTTEVSFTAALSQDFFVLEVDASASKTKSLFVLSV